MKKKMKSMEDGEEEEDELNKCMYVREIITLLPNAYTSTFLAGSTCVTGEVVLEESLNPGSRLCAVSSRAGNWL
jgi:hypothetical protein